ncbi:MAG TPA: SDR family oxidoreductase [Acidimicrobiia bacterium]|nr:SDR family oxidoreductase [Acidimicrobiia bacterium]
MSDDMGGKVVLITGGNAGIGKETAIGLAKLGATVVITSRNAERGRDALAEIKQRSGSDRVDVMQLDLASLASVRSFADAFLARYDRLDVLVENAGLVLGSRNVTEDGFETTFQVNHLGHFLLTELLRDRLVASAPSRVVVVASDAHKSARRGLDFDDLQSSRYRSFNVYAKSKLANILFTRELARRLDGTGVTANVVHPGFVASRFGRDGDLGMLGKVTMPLMRPFALNAEQGARTSVYVASDPALEGVTGTYWVRCAPVSPSDAALDDDAARELWERSVAMVSP